MALLYKRDRWDIPPDDCSELTYERTQTSLRYMRKLHLTQYICRNIDLW